MGPGLASLRGALATLSAEDLSLVPAVELGDRIVELRRLIDGLEGVWSRLVATFDGSASLAADGGTAAWLRTACRVSPGAARGRVVLARRLAELPAVESALVGGEISVDHARLVTTALAELEEAAGGELALGAQEPLLDAGRRCDPARLRREIAHARHALAPESALAADERAHERRRLDVASTFDGTVVVNGVLDAEGGEALLTALAPLSGRAGPDDDRSPGRRRADGLVELCRRALDSGGLPAQAGERPHLTVLVPLAALRQRVGPPVRTGPNRLRPSPAPDLLPIVDAIQSATVDTTAVNAATAGATTVDAATVDPATVDPATVDPATVDPATVDDAAAGFGGTSAAETIWGAVLSADAARRLACDASVTRVVTGPDSQPLDVGRRTRVVPPAIRTALVVRDRGCIFPGCDRPPPWTDAHHVHHWADGGPTSLDNLVLLCRRHHRTVHEGQWAVGRDPTGRWTVTPPRRAGPASTHAA